MIYPWHCVAISCKNRGNRSAVIQKGPFATRIGLFAGSRKRLIPISSDHPFVTFCYHFPACTEHCVQRCLVWAGPGQDGWWRSKPFRIYDMIPTWCMLCYAIWPYWLRCWECQRSSAISWRWQPKRRSGQTIAHLKTGGDNTNNLGRKLRLLRFFRPPK